MMKSLLLCSTLLVFAASAQAEEEKKADQTPSKEAVKTIPYSPQMRTSLTIQKGLVTNITFNPNEVIKRVVLMEPGPVGTLKDNSNQNALINNLPIYGNSPGKTSMVVITSSVEGRERSYLFSVTVVTGPANGEEDQNATFSLTFSYSKSMVAAAAHSEAAPAAASSSAPRIVHASWKQKQAIKDKEVTEAKLNSDVTFGIQNDGKYLIQGRSGTIAPVDAMDNGRITSLRYPGNMGVPAIFVVQSSTSGIPSTCTTLKGVDNEAPEERVQFEVNGDSLVVKRTAAHFRLRSGREVIDIYNCGYNPIGYDPGTGTSSPDLVRRVVTSR